MAAAHYQHGTTIIPFLMVFLIQNSQNRDNAAIQVKLDEIIRASKANTLFVGIKHLSDEEIDELREQCEEHAKQADERVRHIYQKADRAADEAG